MTGVNKNPSQRELRQFGVVVLGGFAVIGLLLWFKGEILSLFAWGRGPTSGLSALRIVAIVLWSAGVAVFALSRVSTAATRPVYIIWMTVAVAIGKVMTPVGFTVLFFIFLPVFSLIRLTDPLRKRLGRTETYWEDHPPHEPTLERAARPF